jgi:alanyl-tRNA synthetase
LQVDKVFRANISKNHTAEHLLEHVMNKYIDKTIKQEGAYKNDQYFTFDFRLNRKLTEKELSLVEEKVNESITLNLPVTTTIKSNVEEVSDNTVGHFTEKYKKIKNGLRIVSIKDINDELCGGTHVNSTSDIQQFLIVEYSSKGAGL